MPSAKASNAPGAERQTGESRAILINVVAFSMSSGIFISTSHLPSPSQEFSQMNQPTFWPRNNAPS